VLLFGGNAAIKKPNGAIEVVDHLPDLQTVPVRDFARIKMTWCSIALPQNEPFTRARGWLENESQEPCRLA
jgi:hypothetical protein